MQVCKKTGCGAPGVCKEEEVWDPAGVSSADRHAMQSSRMRDLKRNLYEPCMTGCVDLPAQCVLLPPHQCRGAKGTWGLAQHAPLSPPTLPLFPAHTPSLPAHTPSLRRPHSLSPRRHSLSSPPTLPLSPPTLPLRMKVSLEGPSSPY
eukprot:356313-Chlamydomonas_euryale.AAC.2